MFYKTKTMFDEIIEHTKKISNKGCKEVTLSVDKGGNYLMTTNENNMVFHNTYGKKPMNSHECQTIVYTMEYDQGVDFESMANLNALYMFQQIFNEYCYDEAC